MAIPVIPGTPSVVEEKRELELCWKTLSRRNNLI
jgi:hypothetical protein